MSVFPERELPHSPRWTDMLMGEHKDDLRMSGIPLNRPGSTKVQALSFAAEVSSVIVLLIFPLYET